MSEAFYKTVRGIGRGVFHLASRPMILHAERAGRPGAFILAANHASPVDSALIIHAAARVIHWISIVELFRRPFPRWFLSGMLAFPLDRSRADAATMRAVARRLRDGEVVGIFPEGGVRRSGDSVLRGGRIDDGVCKLAQLAGVPVIPCAVVGGENFASFPSWLPLRRTRWAVAFGEPIALRNDLPRAEARRVMVEQLQDAFRALQAEVRDHVPPHRSSA